MCANEVSAYSKMKIRIRQRIRKVLSFIKEVKLEMKKVNWLSARETLKYTLIVLFASVVVAICLGSVDFLFTKLLDRFIL